MRWDGSRAQRRGHGVDIAATSRSRSAHLARLVTGTSTALVATVVAVAGCGQRDIDALKPRRVVTQPDVDRAVDEPTNTLPLSPSTATTAHRSRVVLIGHSV